MWMITQMAGQNILCSRGAGATGTSGESRLSWFESRLCASDSEQGRICLSRVVISA